MAFVVGVDIGGTFTDCAVLDDAGVVTTAKALSTPSDYVVGIRNALGNVANKLGLSGADDLGARSRLFVHACTVADNTLLSGREEQRVGLITTAGFRDTLSMMRGLVRQGSAKPDDLVPPELIVEVNERIDSNGVVIVDLKEDDVRQALDALAEQRATAVAVALLWSTANDTHETLVAEVAKQSHPDLPVLLSSAVAPYVGEYERTATAVVAALVAPRLEKYLIPLVSELRSLGFEAEPLIMQAYGGTVRVADAIRRPIGVIESGPAAGVLGCAVLGELLGYKDVLVTDMGGTTFKVGLVIDGHLSTDRLSTLLGHTLFAEKVRLESIGAGGGSIAWVDKEAKLLKVGPQGAGALPGPVCYGFGGTEPTVADSDLLLGYLAPDAVLGGEVGIDVEAARKAMESRIASPLDMSTERAAQGIFQIVNAHMAGLIRRCTVAQGLDPREFTVFAIGGAAPMHAGRYCRDLGIKCFVVPHTASVQGALGLLMSDVLVAQMKVVNLRLPADADELNVVFEDLYRKALADADVYGVPREEFVATRFFDVKYRYQVNEIRLELGAIGTPISDEAAAEIASRYENQYVQTFGPGSSFESAEKVIVSARLEMRHRLTRPEMSGAGELTRGNVGVPAPRRVWFEGHGWVEETPVHRIADMEVGRRYSGPAIFIDDVTTIVVEPNDAATRDQLSNVVVEVGA